MKKKIILLLLLTTLLMPINVKAWEGYNSGTDTTAAGCDTALTGWCMWNNSRFSLAKVSVWYYDNGVPVQQYGETVLFYNGSLSNNDVENAKSNTGVRTAYKANYWPTSSESYSDIDNILRDNDYNLRDLLEHISANGYEDLKNRVENKIPGETLGIGAAQGYRIIIEPVFKIMSNKNNKTVKPGLVVLDTLRHMLTDPNIRQTEDSQKTFGLRLFVLVSDVYDAVNCTDLNNYTGMREHGGPGCSIGVYAPFDNIDSPPSNECKERTTFQNCERGTIEDPTFSCILVKENESSDYYTRTPASNNYCQVVCRDEVTYTYPNASGIKNVLQGAFMTIGANSFENVKGAVSIGQVQIRNKRTCRVTGKGNDNKGANTKETGLINFDRFVAENASAWNGVLNANGGVINASDLYEHVKNKTSNMISIRTQGEGNCKNNCNVAEEFYNSHPDCRDIPEGNTPREKEQAQAKREQCNRDLDEYSKTHPMERYTTYTYSAGNWSITYSEQYDNLNNTEGPARTYLRDQAYNNLVNARKSFNSAMNAYETTINYWNACSDGSILNSIKNDLEGTAVVLDYTNIDKNGNVIYKYEDTNLYAQSAIQENADMKTYGRDTDAKSENLPINSIGYNKNMSSNFIYYYDANNGTIYGGKYLQYGNNVGWWQKSQTTRISFTLPQTGYRYKTIPDGLYTKEKPNVDNHVDLEEGVMPVSISTPRGRTYKFNLAITSLGSVLTAKYAKYLPSTSAVCEYKVDCDDYIVDPTNPTACRETRDVYCADSNTPVPCGDVKIIYRTISLREGEAFPGVNAEGRRPGDNWNDPDYVSYTDSKRYKYIYNNRGVTGYDVYNLDPMYEITLTPSVMRQYRRYNRVANSRIGRSLNTANNTAIMGYADFASMVCSVQSMGDYTCTSSLLRGVTEYGRVTGSGSDDMIVKGCAVRNGGSYNNCGDQSIVNNQAWAMNISKENS